MLSKLRNNFLILNMTLILLTLFAAFAVVYFVTSITINNDNKNKLNAVISVSVPTENDGSVELLIGDQKNAELMKTFGMPAFTLFVDEKGTLLEIQNVFESAFSGFNSNTKVSVLPFGAIEINTRDLDVSSLYNPFLEIMLANRGVEMKATIEGRVWLYSVIDIANNITQVTFLDITDSINRLNSLMLTFTFVGAVMIVFVMLISLFMANRSIKPVKAVWEKQRQFVADASHELKTPLTVMTSTYSALQANENETIKSQSEFFGYMKSGMDRMEKLIYALLNLAQIENTKINVAKEPFNIAEVIRAVVEPFETKINEKGIALSCDLPQEIISHSNRGMVESVFEILFDNAVKYTDIDGKINVKLVYENRNIV